MAKKKNKAAQQLGRLGGLARKYKFTHEDFVKWGKAGGRPKKNKKSVDTSLKPR